MPQSTINFRPYDAKTKLTNQHGNIETDAHRSLLSLYNGHPLIKIDTSTGTPSFAVPLAKMNQNVELTFIKVSSDANVPILTASGNDLLNAPGSWASTQLHMAAAQGSKLRLKSDGVSNWYVAS